MGDWSHLARPLVDTRAVQNGEVFYCPDGCTWDIKYPRDVGRFIGYYVRWGINPYRYSLEDPSGIVLVTEPCGWWGGWSHPPHRGAQEGSGFNLLFLDGSVDYNTVVPAPLAAGFDTGYNNWWWLWDRRDVPIEWYQRPDKE